MKVDLISFTPDALNLLLYTKEARMGGDSFYNIRTHWNNEKKLEQLNYMLKTIKGSFEFVDYVFDISGVSRAFTHQLVRTRTASFQQESMRAVDVREASYTGPDSLNFTVSMKHSLDRYAYLVDQGMPIQDARGLLPMAIHTKILMKANLRTLSQMAEHRLCTRTQGEYQEVFKLMRDKVLVVHPWAAPLLEPYCVQTGVCCFPNYKECPIQPFTLPYTDRKRASIKEKADATTHIANPVAKEGRTM